MGDTPHLDKKVGQTKYQYCGECGRKVNWVFCHRWNPFKDDYYWKCNAGHTVYVKS